MVGWGLRADWDIGPYGFDPVAWRATTRRALEAGQAGGASPSPTRMIRNMARRDAHCAPAVDHSMTREAQQQAPCWWGYQSLPEGPGAASIGGLSGFLLRCAGQIFPRPLPAAPVKSGGPGDNGVEIEGGCAA